MATKEAETPKEAVRPPKNGHGNSGGSLEAETPNEAKKAKEAVRVTMDMLLRLRADVESNYPYTGDDPRANGRAEVAVNSIKIQIRRVLLQAEANASWWPWATRFVNELNRASRVGKKSWRKRKWREGTFDVSTEKVQYLYALPMKNMDIGFCQRTNLRVRGSPKYE